MKNLLSIYLIVFTFTLVASPVPLSDLEWTGDAQADFLPISASQASLVYVSDTIPPQATSDWSQLPESSVDVGVPIQLRDDKGTLPVSGWDVRGLFFAYDGERDELHVGVDCFGLCGDADGDGNPGAASPTLTSLGGQDLPNLARAEGFALILDLDLDAADVLPSFVPDNNVPWDFVLGVPAGQPAGAKANPGPGEPALLACTQGQSQNDLLNMANCFGLYEYQQTTAVNVASRFLRRAQLNGQSWPVVNRNPQVSAARPDLEWTVGAWSDLLALKGVTALQESRQRPWTMLGQLFAGSFVDDGIGEDFMPSQTSYFEVPFPCHGAGCVTDAPTPTAPTGQPTLEPTPQPTTPSPTPAPTPQPTGAPTPVPPPTPLGDLEWTGDAQADFLPISASQASLVYVSDTIPPQATSDWSQLPESLVDVGVPPQLADSTTGTLPVSGWDVRGLFFAYDGERDELHVGVDCFGLCGDADGDGDPGSASPTLTSLGGQDLPNLARAEGFALILDLDLDVADVLPSFVPDINVPWDFVLGVPAGQPAGAKANPGPGEPALLACTQGQSQNDLLNMANCFGLYEYQQTTAVNVASRFLRRAQLNGQSWPVVNRNPQVSAARPDLEWTVGAWSDLLALKGVTALQESRQRPWTMLGQLFAGSFVDDGIGEDFLPSQTNYFEVHFPCYAGGCFTDSPTSHPTFQPTPQPTLHPTPLPTSQPTLPPTPSPTFFDCRNFNRLALDCISHDCGYDLFRDLCSSCLALSLEECSRFSGCGVVQSNCILVPPTPQPTAGPPTFSPTPEPTLFDCRNFNRLALDCISHDCGYDLFRDLCNSCSALSLDDCSRFSGCGVVQSKCILVPPTPQPTAGPPTFSPSPVPTFSAAPTPVPTAHPTFPITPVPTPSLPCEYYNTQAFACLANENCGYSTTGSELCKNCVSIPSFDCVHFYGCGNDGRGFCVPMEPTPAPPRTPSPTGIPTSSPTPWPTPAPTVRITSSPTPVPTQLTMAPTARPTFSPTPVFCPSLNGRALDCLNSPSCGYNLGTDACRECLQVDPSACAQFTGCGLGLLSCVAVEPTPQPTNLPTPVPTPTPVPSPSPTRSQTCPSSNTSNDWSTLCASEHEVYTTCVYAGQSIYSGTVSIRFNGDSLDVTYEASENCELAGTMHVFAGTHEEWLTTNFAPGSFNHHAQSTQTNAIATTVRESELARGGIVQGFCVDGDTEQPELIVAVHLEQECNGKQETGWAFGEPFENTNQWGWLNRVPCCDSLSSPVVQATIADDVNPLVPVASAPVVSNVELCDFDSSGARFNLKSPSGVRTLKACHRGLSNLALVIQSADFCQELANTGPTTGQCGSGDKSSFFQLVETCTNCEVALVFANTATVNRKRETQFVDLYVNVQIPPTQAPTASPTFRPLPRDCFGSVWGTNVLDQCGVCGGDGLSCGRQSTGEEEEEQGESPSPRTVLLNEGSTVSSRAFESAKVVINSANSNAEPVSIRLACCNSTSTIGGRLSVDLSGAPARSFLFNSSFEQDILVVQLSPEQSLLGSFDAIDVKLPDAAISCSPTFSTKQTMESDEIGTSQLRISVVWTPPPENCAHVSIASTSLTAPSFCSSSPGYCALFVILALSLTLTMALTVYCLLALRRDERAADEAIARRRDARNPGNAMRSPRRDYQQSPRRRPTDRGDEIRSSGRHSRQRSNPSTPRAAHPRGNRDRPKTPRRAEPPSYEMAMLNFGSDENHADAISGNAFA